MKTKIIKNITYWSGVVILGLVVGISIQFVAAWTEPTQAPPGGNVGAPVNTGDLGQIKNGNLILNALGNYLTGLLVNGNLQIANGKGYSPSTTEADPGNTLVTKDYVDAQSEGVSWIFLNGKDEEYKPTEAVVTLECPTGMKIVGYRGDRTCYSDGVCSFLTLGEINNIAPISGGTTLCSSQSCTEVTLGISTSLTCRAAASFSVPSGKACVRAGIICSK